MWSAKENTDIEAWDAVIENNDKLLEKYIAEELILQKTGMTVEQLAKQELTKEYAVELIAESENLQAESSKESENEQSSEEQTDTLEDKVLDFLIENLK